jgi:hypothetical protein
MSIESPLLFVRIDLLTMHAIGSKPLASIGDTLVVGQSFTKHRYA